MPGESLFDLELLGFRNDLAQARALALLRTRPELSAVGTIAVDTPFPHRLAVRLPHAQGLALLGTLRDCGAHARLIPSAEAPGAKAVEVSVPLAPSPPPPPPPARRSRWLIGVASLGLVGVVLSRWVPPPPALPPRPPSALEGEVADSAPSGLQQLNDEAVALNATGEFAAAAERLRGALREAPDQPALQRNLQTVLRNWAVAEINAGRLDDAVRLLEEALALGQNGAVLGVLGIARVRQGDWRGGRQALEQAGALGVSDRTTLTALAEAHRQLGDRAAAVEALHGARDAGAGGADFDNLLARLERELDAEWEFDETRSAHFTISFAGGERDQQVAAELVSRGLEEAYFHVGNKLDVYPDERVPAVLYPSEDFHDVTQTPSWTAGVYDGRIKLPVGGLIAQDHAILQRTLRHEYGHVLVHQLCRTRCPVWLNEGVAIWGEEDHEGERAAWARQAIAGHELFRLDQLAGPFTRLPTERVPVAYAQSYLAVRALVDQHGARRLRELLASLGSGAPLPQAFRATLYEDLAAFEAVLVRDLTS